MGCVALGEEVPIGMVGICTPEDMVGIEGSKDGSAIFSCLFFILLHTTSDQRGVGDLGTGGGGGGSCGSCWTCCRDGTGCISFAGIGVDDGTSWSLSV